MTLSGNPHSARRASALVRATVKEWRKHGALVELDDGRLGWLPAKEVVPDIRQGEDLSACDRRPAAEAFDVVIFDEEFHGDRPRPIVSYVRAHNDPWDEVTQWADGAVKVMEVYITTATHAFGTIPPGVRAQMRVADLQAVFGAGPWRQFAAPYPGDEIAGRVRRDRINRRERLVTLDVADFIQSPVSVADALAPETVECATPPQSADPTVEARRPSLALGLVKRLLILDDDEPLARAVAAYLERAGCEVTVCLTGDCALSHFPPPDSPDTHLPPLDLALIDVHLGEGDRAEGLRVAREIQERDPNLSIVLITGHDLEPLDGPLRQSADLMVCALIQKPFGVEQLMQALDARTRAPAPLGHVVAGVKVQVPVRRTADAGSVGDRIHEVLSDLRDELGADAVVLFGIHPVSLKVSLIGRADPWSLVPAVEPNVQRSPVRDVAIGGQRVMTPDARHPAYLPKHRWLVEAYEYVSCIAVPAPAPSELGHAVFAFSRKPEAFDQDDFAVMSRAARSLAALLDAERLEQIIEANRPYEIMGKTYGVMAHELRRELSDMLTDDLVGWLNGKQTLDSADMCELCERVEIIHDRQKRASDILRAFREMAQGASQAESDVTLSALLDALVLRLRNQDRRIHYPPHVQDEEARAARVRLRPAGLEQIVYNVAMNAVQQIDLLPIPTRAESGQVFIELALERRDGARAAVIRVHDNGPGVHRADFEQVFRFGYTTRPDGLGMGLDISRRIAQEVKVGERTGAVRIARSILLAGTTFEVVLPVP